MNDELFAELLESVRQGGAILRGDAEPSRTFKVDAPNIRNIRKQYNLSQEKFASMLGISTATLRNWEQGRRAPEGPARVLLQVAAKHPEAVWDVVGATVIHKRQSHKKMTNTHKQDQWAQWLLQRRHGGDAKQLQAMLDWLYPVRDKVLNHADVQDGDVLLDVGTGDGLIAFGALQRNPACRVIFSDISQDLLDHVQDLARDMNVLDRCRFVHASADDLHHLADASVDVVTTRSVLIYVADKAQAFAEFQRVLKPGGRLSIFEPINSFGYPEPPFMFHGFDATPVQELAQKMRAVYRQHQPPDNDPMLDFNERDLIRLADDAGFAHVHAHVQFDIGPSPFTLDWHAMLHTAPNPKLPTLQEAMDEALTPGEQARVVAHLRPLVETHQPRIRSALAYVWAVK
jgi:DNA-binding transcriptional regulator YiaG/SAM-dependent methyltransferase